MACTIWRTLCFALLLTPVTMAVAAIEVPILVYHRFDTQVSNDMTVTPQRFESQLRQIEELGFKVIALRDYVEYRLGGHAPPPPCSVIITVDDGHASVYTNMAPIVKRHGVPVTLFIYPSAISNASYAMTWDQLRELSQSGLFDAQSHTYWHPNFRIEKARLAPDQYRSFVHTQLTKSREILERELHTTVTLLAWPFGIHDQELIGLASDAGYVAGLTLNRRAAIDTDELLALPRYLVRDSDTGPTFAAILGKHGGKARCTG